MRQLTTLLGLGHRAGAIALITVTLALFFAGCASSQRQASGCEYYLELTGDDVASSIGLASTETEIELLIRDKPLPIAMRIVAVDPTSNGRGQSREVEEMILEQEGANGNRSFVLRRESGDVMLLDPNDDRDDANARVASYLARYLADRACLK